MKFAFSWPPLVFITFIQRSYKYILIYLLYLQDTFDWLLLSALFSHRRDYKMRTSHLGLTLMKELSCDLAQMTSIKWPVQ